MNPHTQATPSPTKKTKPASEVRYNDKIAARVCAEIASRPVSLCEICRDPDMPAICTVFRWLREHPEFREMYVIAKQEQVELLMEQCLDLVRDDSGDYLERDGRTILNPIAVKRHKLQVDYYKWIASKLLPRKYGNNAQLDAAAPPPPPPPEGGGYVLTVEKLLHMQALRQRDIDRMRAEDAAKSKAHPPSAKEQEEDRYFCRPSEPPRS